jgi:hypothetical protein
LNADSARRRPGPGSDIVIECGSSAELFDRTAGHRELALPKPEN